MIQPWLRKQFKKNWAGLGAVARLWLPGHRGSGREVSEAEDKVTEAIHACIQKLAQDHQTVGMLRAHTHHGVDLLRKMLRTCKDVRDLNRSIVFQARDNLESLSWVLSSVGYEKVAWELAELDREVAHDGLREVMRRNEQELEQWVTTVWQSNANNWWAIPTDALRMEVERMEMEEEQNE